MKSQQNANQPQRHRDTEKNDINLVTERIIGCAIEVHRVLGPGLLEAMYQSAICIEQLHPVFEAQVLTYLRLTGKRVGLLLNFNSRVLKDGIKRLIL
jgi:hypothetical protein